jgi:hypothetical protein
MKLEEEINEFLILCRDRRDDRLLAKQIENPKKFDSVRREAMRHGFVNVRHELTDKGKQKCTTSN